MKIDKDLCSIPVIEQIEETVVQESKNPPVRVFYGFGFSGDELNPTPFITISKHKTPPFAIKGLRLIWKIGGIVTNKEVCTKSNYEPTVGDIGNTQQGEIIEVVSVDYY